MTETYAASVVRVLREHFPDLADPDVAEVTYHAINQQMRDPRDSFEFIVDDPFSAKWRLKAKPGRDRRHIRLRCYRYNRRQSDNDLEDAVNDALAALEPATAAGTETTDA
jgi:hypothetical protein